MSFSKHTYVKSELPSAEQMAIGCHAMLSECLWAKAKLAESATEYETEDSSFDYADIHIDDLKRIIRVHNDLPNLFAIFLVALNEEAAQ